MNGAWTATALAAGVNIPDHVQLCDLNVHRFLKLQKFGESVVTLFSSNSHDSLQCPRASSGQVEISACWQNRQELALQQHHGLSSSTSSWGPRHNLHADSRRFSGHWLRWQHFKGVEHRQGGYQVHAGRTHRRSLDFADLSVRTLYRQWIDRQNCQGNLCVFSVFVFNL